VDKLPLSIAPSSLPCMESVEGVIICPIAKNLLYHSMGQIIKSVFLSVYVCMYVCVCVCVCGHAYGRIFQPIFTKFGKNLWGLNRKN